LTIRRGVSHVGSSLIPRSSTLSSTSTRTQTFIPADSAHFSRYYAEALLESFPFGQAIDHWLEYGIVEGRQACGAFHTLQYFQRYPALAKQLGNNLKEGIINYVSTGKAQGLVGIVDGGAYGRFVALSAVVFHRS
jgi:hypothetical protein